MNVMMMIVVETQTQKLGKSQTLSYQLKHDEMTSCVVYTSTTVPEQRKMSKNGRGTEKGTPQGQEDSNENECNTV